MCKSLISEQSSKLRLTGNIRKRDENSLIFRSISIYSARLGAIKYFYVSINDSLTSFHYSLGSEIDLVTYKTQLKKHEFKKLQQARLS